MIFSLGLSAKHIEKNFSAKKYFFAAVWILISIICIVLPSVVETMYLLDMSYFLILIISGVYTLALPVLFIFSRLGKAIIKG